MVYYQSTPLIVKTEQSSQAQYCGAPLQLAAASSTTSDVASLQNYVAIGNIIPTPPSSVNSTSSSSSLPSHITTTSINNLPNSNYLANIKTELLPPSITLYATTSVVPSSNSNNSNISNNVYLASSSATSAAAATSATTITTTTPAARRKPTSSNGTKPQFKCEQCGMTFNSKSAHTSHTKSHMKNGDFGLNALGGQILQSNAIEVNEAGVPLGIPKTPQIKANASVVPGGDPYECNVCHKTFAVPARLIRHYRTHTGERPFECEFCHKLFSVKENLQVHRRIHTKERPYKCDVCGRAFEHSGKLHRHMRIHTGERPHKCSVCEKTFIQSGQLVIHMRTHTGEKPYKCPVEGCGKGFTCSKQLKVHSRTHTGEKPYHCDICFRDFGYNHVLKLHRVQHYGSKCYKCTICDETFKSKKEMEAHIKGHANEMPDDDETATGAEDTKVLLEANASSSETNTSGPNSPQSPSSSAGASVAIKIKKERKPKASLVKAPASPSSPSSTLSPSCSSMGSASRLSTGSPTMSLASPMSLIMDTDHHSRDSGVASSSTLNRQMSASSMPNDNVYLAYEEMPTDLSTNQQYQHHSQHAMHSQVFSMPSQMQHHPNYVRRCSPVYVSSSPTHQLIEHHHQAQQLQQQHSPPTINQVLVEAAAIRHREQLPNTQEDVTQAALQIMQLRRSQKPSSSLVDVPPQPAAAIHMIPQLSSAAPYGQSHHMLIGEHHHYDDTQEANQLIEHYKRGELARHGIHKGYAPVPKFESSFLNNEIIVRQVEAAIAPLRSSTESPERSSSPESDTMLMADRDVMTLPLRKRKLYMNEERNGGGISLDGANGQKHTENSSGSTEAGSKVMRMSSVIQFAKAS